MEPLCCQRVGGCRPGRRSVPRAAAIPAASERFRTPSRTFPPGLVAVAVLVIALWPGLSLAGPAGPAAIQHVRPLEPHLTVVLDRGLERSPTLRRLVDAIEASDLVVYVERNNRFRRSAAGEFHLVGRAGDFRYARISLSSALTDRELAVILAHELQHATELAAAPAVETQRQMRDFYCQIGDRWPYVFDTAAARAVTERVGEELAQPDDK